MQDPESFENQQDAEIQSAHEEFKTAAKLLQKCKAAGSPRREQISQLTKCTESGRKFFRVLNKAIVDSGPIRGPRFEKWRKGCIDSALNVLSELPLHQKIIRGFKEDFDLPKEKYEFAPAVFGNIQGVLAWYKPEEAKNLKELFKKNDLPIDGFNSPIELKEQSETTDNPWSTKQKNADPPKDKPNIFSFLTPEGGILSALKIVPGFAYVIGIIGLCGAISLVTQKYKVPPLTAIFGAVIFVVLIVLILIFGQAAKMVQTSGAQLPAKVLVWSFLIIAILTAFGLFTSVFVNGPLPLRDYIIFQINKTPGGG